MKKPFFIIHVHPTPPQQIIKLGAMEGHHNVVSIDYLDATIQHFEKMLQQAEDYNHIALFRDYVKDPLELREYLISSYKKTIRMHKINLINLLFTEN